MNIQVFKIYKNIFKPILFSLGIVCGTYIAIIELYTKNNPNSFLFFSFLTSFIFFFQLIDHFFRKNTKVQINFNFNDHINELWELCNKVFIPSLIYIGVVLYSGFHITSMNVPILMVFFFVLLIILFLNVGFFFENNTYLEKKTHFVYDLIKFTLFYLYVDSFVNWTGLQKSSVNIFITCFIIFFTSFILKLAILWRSNISNRTNLHSTILSSFVISALYLFFVFTDSIRITEISWFLLYSFYISIAIIHHRAVGTFTKKALYEYILVSCLLLTIFVGLR